MQERFWHERWEERRIGFHRETVHPQLMEHWGTLALAPGAGVFVPLCGKSLDMLWLRSQGFAVTGVELSPIAVRDLFGEHGLQPSVTPHGRLERWAVPGLAVLRGDVLDVTAAHVDACAGVFDRAALIALPPEMRERYSRHLIAVLPADARMLLVTMEYDQRQTAGPPFSVPEREVLALYGDRFHVRCLHEWDALPDEPGLRSRGVTRLAERVHLLTPR